MSPYLRPIRSLTDRVDPKDVAKIHGILDALSAEEKAKFNLVETEGERYSNHWYVLCRYGFCRSNFPFKDVLRSRW